jgi:hypothetical protein
MIRLVENTAEVALILGVALLVLPLMRRQSAALRHALLAAAFACAAAAPGLGLLAPSWRLPAPALAAPAGAALAPARPAARRLHLGRGPAAATVLAAVPRPRLSAAAGRTRRARVERPPGDRHPDHVRPAEGRQPEGRRAAARRAAEALAPAPRPHAPGRAAASLALRPAPRPSRDRLPDGPLKSSGHRADVVRAGLRLGGLRGRGRLGGAVPCSPRPRSSADRAQVS